MKIIPESATQIEDPKIQTRLTTIQGVGLSIETKIEIAKTELHRAQGIVAGLTAAAASEIPATMAEVGRLVDENGIDEDIAKEAIAWLQKARERVELAVKMNSRSIAKQEGVIEGLSKSVDECETLFKQEIAKAKQREGGTGKRDEGGRPIPLREQRENETLPLRGRSEASEVLPAKVRRPRKKKLAN